MPAEWEKQNAVYFSWPHNKETWPKQIVQVKEVYGAMIRAVNANQVVKLLIKDEIEKEEALRHIADKATAVEFLMIPTVDAWIRDYGPTVIVTKESSAFVHWTFNAWGMKYPELALDTAIPPQIARQYSKSVFRPGIVLEGGSIEVNGKGTLLTTKQCLLNKNRNPHLTQKQIEAILCEYLGVTNFLWLSEGIEGDDTDGHIDDIARFVNQTTVVCAVEEKRSNTNYAALRNNYDYLCNARDQDGVKLTVIRLPMPTTIEDDFGPLPASYANFLITNACVLVPVFDDANDAIALEILQKLFSKRKVIPINARDLVYGMGTIHCLSQQEPAPQ